MVLDLGSGGGIDVLLSAKRVGPTGKAYGLDMTDEMLALARENQRKAGVDNVEFLKGEIEHIPLPDNSVDRDHLQLRDQSLGRQGPRAARGVPGAEAGRALRRLRRGGAGRDAGRDPPQRGAVGRLRGRRAGGKRLHGKLAAAGFEDIAIEPTRVYHVEDAREFLSGHGIDVDAIAPLVDDRFFSGFIRARKPAK